MFENICVYISIPARLPVRWLKQRRSGHWSIHTVRTQIPYAVLAFKLVFAYTVWFRVLMAMSVPSGAPAPEEAAAALQHIVLADECDNVISQFVHVPSLREAIRLRDQLQRELNVLKSTETEFKASARVGKALNAAKEVIAMHPLSERDYLLLAESHATLMQKVAAACKKLLLDDDYDALDTLASKLEELKALDVSDLPQSWANDPVPPPAPSAPTIATAGDDKRVNDAAHAVPAPGSTAAFLVSADEPTSSNVPALLPQTGSEDSLPTFAFPGSAAALEAEEEWSNDPAYASPAPDSSSGTAAASPLADMREEECANDPVHVSPAPAAAQGTVSPASTAVPTGGAAEEREQWANDPVCVAPPPNISHGAAVALPHATTALAPTAQTGEEEWANDPIYVPPAAGTSQGTAAASPYASVALSTAGEDGEEEWTNDPVYISPAPVTTQRSAAPAASGVDDEEGANDPVYVASGRGTSQHGHSDAQLQRMKEETVGESSKNLTEGMQRAAYEQLRQAEEAQAQRLQQVLDSNREAAVADLEAAMEALRVQQSQAQRAGGAAADVTEQLQQLQASLNAIRAAEDANSYGLHEVPLLVVVVPVAHKGTLKDVVRRSLYEVYRLHFCCPACGTRAASGPNQHGYKLRSATGGAKQAFKLLKVTLFALQVASLSTPLPLPHLAELTQWLSIEETEAVSFATCCLRRKLKGNIIATIADARAALEKELASNHKAPSVTREHVSSVKTLLLKAGESIPPKHSGLAPVVCAGTRECAWVCAACSDTYRERGNACLAVSITLD
jgi:hypothetical protein